MRGILFGVLAAVASLMLVDSLTCNKCKYGINGYCLSSSEVSCTTNTSVCFTGSATFPSVSSSVGFSSQGCTEPTTGCNTTANSTLLGVTLSVQLTCCSTDKCNPAQNSAPSTKMTLAAALGAAILASAWGSML